MDQRKTVRNLSMVLLFALLWITLFCFPVETWASNLIEGDWVYEITATSSGGDPGDPFSPPGATSASVTLLWGTDDVKGYQVVMLPAALGDESVATVGNAAQNVLSNNKVSNNYVLVPEGIDTISARAFYDYNDTVGWSIPLSVSVDDNAFVSCLGDVLIDGVENGTAALDFTISADANGYIQPNGEYYLPAGMLTGSYSVPVSIVSDIGYKIASLIVDDDEEALATGENEYTFTYSFSSDSKGIEVLFEEDPEDDRTAPDTDFVYTAPDILDGAVAELASLPDDVNDYVGLNTGTTEKYTNTMGISTGIYYAADGKLYEMVYSYQNQDVPEYYSKAEVINAVYEEMEMVYGKDYDLIRLYNYYENVTSGPSSGEVLFYCTYLYKEYRGRINGEEIVVEDSYVNTAAIFAQEGADLTVFDLTEYVYTKGVGPSEAGNFFGLGSSIHVDGGDNGTAATKYLNTDTANLRLINPQILGTVNSIYSLANGVLEIEGGDVFSCSSGGHGPYVSTGGEVFLNTRGTELLVEDEDTGLLMANITPETIRPTRRPSSDLGTMERIDDVIQGVYEPHPNDVTVIVTGDEAGTALATDTGGGLIVANQVTTKTFGLRCAGVYSIGSNESWVNCYNSTLTSYLDAGLCSASGGYIYAFNCDITGVMGMKTRAGGNATATETGVHVYNSRVSAYYDYDEMVSAYDVADPDDWDDSMADTSTSSTQLNIFLDKANSPNFIEESLTWWFVDKSKTPGYSGGNKFAVIYVENASTPIVVNSSYLVNQNYLEYGDASTLGDDETPADNLLVSVESAGTANLIFVNENHRTKWDISMPEGKQRGNTSRYAHWESYCEHYGKQSCKRAKEIRMSRFREDLSLEDPETCELFGDFYLGAESSSDGDQNAGTGVNTLNASFENSEWEGTIILEDDTGAANLTFDEQSIWFVTGDASVGNLTLAHENNLVADEAVTITVTGSLVIGEETITETTTVGNVTLVPATE
jgi:hypothetical protein